MKSLLVRLGKKRRVPGFEGRKGSENDSAPTKIRRIGAVENDDDDLDCKTEKSSNGTIAKASTGKGKNRPKDGSVEKALPRTKQRQRKRSADDDSDSDCNTEKSSNGTIAKASTGKGKNRPKDGSIDKALPRTKQRQRKRSPKKKKKPPKESHDQDTTAVSPKPPTIPPKRHPITNYLDYSTLPDPPRQSMFRILPEKLYHMLEQTELEGNSHIVSFLDHGRAFAVHDEKTFVKVLLTRFGFRQKLIESFVVAMIGLGFKQIQSGPDQGAFYHEMFLRGRPGLCINLGKNPDSRDTPDPNFEEYPPMPRILNGKPITTSETIPKEPKQQSSEGSSDSPADSKKDNGISILILRNPPKADDDKISTETAIPIDPNKQNSGSDPPRENENPISTEATVPVAPKEQTSGSDPPKGNDDKISTEVTIPNAPKQQTSASSPPRGNQNPISTEAEIPKQQTSVSSPPTCNENENSTKATVPIDPKQQQAAGSDAPKGNDDSISKTKATVPIDPKQQTSGSDAPKGNEDSISTKATVPTAPEQQTSGSAGPTTKGNETATKRRWPAGPKKKVGMERFMPNMLPDRHFKTHYADFAGFPDPPRQKLHPGKGGDLFPLHLHGILHQIQIEGNSHIISFRHHGRAFSILNEAAFEKSLMPRFFPKLRFKDFVQLLVDYGFEQLTSGPDDGAFYHELFLRSRPGLCVNMSRGARPQPFNPAYPPNFYQYPPMPDIFIPPPAAVSANNAAAPAAAAAAQQNLPQMPQGNNAVPPPPPFAAFPTPFGPYGFPVPFPMMHHRLPPHLTTPIVTTAQPTLVALKPTAPETTGQANGLLQEDAATKQSDSVLENEDDTRTTTTQGTGSSQETASQKSQSLLESEEETRAVVAV